MAAATQRPAAVVSPCTAPRDWMMVPAPRKPMPETICAAMRPGSQALLPAAKVAPTWIETWVSRAEPTAISMWVRRPAHLPLHSRCAPTAPARSAERPIFKATVARSLLIRRSSAYWALPRRGAARQGRDAAADRGVVPVGLADELLQHLPSHHQVGLRELLGAVAV